MWQKLYWDCIHVMRYISYQNLILQKTWLIFFVTKIQDIILSSTFDYIKFNSLCFLKICHLIMKHLSSLSSNLNSIPWDHVKMEEKNMLHKFVLWIPEVDICLSVPERERGMKGERQREIEGNRERDRNRDRNRERLIGKHRQRKEIKCEQSHNIIILYKIHWNGW